MDERRSPATPDPRALQSPITDPNRAQWVFRTGLLVLGIGLYVAATLRDRRPR
ncbi:MAG: hypothetical protein IPK07_16585 [Deltaproteobacteria bacterium]|nr:hypothetical protein [Deltaproteobacteria bacterium]